MRTASLAAMVLILLPVGCRSSEPAALPTMSPPPTKTPHPTWAPAGLLPVDMPTPTPNEDGGWLRITPDRVRLGGSFTAEGFRCTPWPVGYTTLALQAAPPRDTGTYGSYTWRVFTSRSGYFSIVLGVPPEMGQLQGRGGGTTRPGTYYFRTYPPICNAELTVTG